MSTEAPQVPLSAEELADNIEQNGLCNDPLWPPEARALIVRGLRALTIRAEAAQSWQPSTAAPGMVWLQTPGEDVTFYCLSGGKLYEWTMKMPDGFTSTQEGK